MSRQVSIVVFILMLASTVAWCSPISFSGSISEITGKSIEGAIISIERNGQVIQSTQSHEDGSFSITIEGPLVRMDQVKVTIKKKGFKTEIALPLNGKNQNMNIILERLTEPIPLLNPGSGNPALFI